jgi:hypothetical protein
MPPSSDLIEGESEKMKFEGAAAIVLEKGPFSMLKEDVLDLCTRYGMFITPEQVLPMYRRDPAAVLFRTGWRLMLPTRELRAKAYKMRVHEPKVVRRC